MKNIERAGWTGFTLGAFSGALLIVLMWRAATNGV